MIQGHSSESLVSTISNPATQTLETPALWFAQKQTPKATHVDTELSECQPMSWSPTVFLRGSDGDVDFWSWLTIHMRFRTLYKRNIPNMEEPSISL